MARAEKEAANLQQQLELMDKKFDELAKYFAFDRKKISIEEFFGDLSGFIKDFEVHSALSLSLSLSLILSPIDWCSSLSYSACS